VLSFLRGLFYESEDERYTQDGSGSNQEDHDQRYARTMQSPIYVTCCFVCSGKQTFPGGTDLQRNSANPGKEWPRYSFCLTDSSPSCYAVRFCRVFLTPATHGAEINVGVNDEVQPPFQTLALNTVLELPPVRAGSPTHNRGMII
jgi:hypothetical protein